MADPGRSREQGISDGLTDDFQALIFPEKPEAAQVRRCDCDPPCLAADGPEG